MGSDGDEAVTRQPSKVALKRVKVRETFLRKTFFEKVLVDWKDSVTDRNFRCVLAKALINLKNFPLEVNTASELRNVKGIGEYIAKNLENSWNNFCAGYSSSPKLRDVKCRKRGELLSFLQLDFPSSTKQLCSESKTASFSRKRSATMVLPSVCTSIRGPQAVSVLDTPDDANVQKSTKLLCQPQELEVSKPSVLPSSSKCLDVSPAREVLDEADAASDDYLQYSFSEKDSEDCRFEYRNLSVGDYVWVLRSPGNVEVMLDYIVERKTFRDLSQSIREGRLICEISVSFPFRYEEQKARLLSIGIRNVVYVIEGQGVPDASIEQALVTTHVSNGFLIYRTSSAKETAGFLNIITKRLKDRSRTTSELRMTYETFQRNAKKTKRRCVKDIFLRQLTVCPQMSAAKAALIVNRFPSFLALATYYKLANDEDKEALISNAVPGIPLALSRQLSRFFEKL